MNELTSKMRSTPAMECDSAFKRKDILIPAATWRRLLDMMLSERIETNRRTNTVKSPPIRRIYSSQTQRHREWCGGCQRLQSGTNE
jgi:hypothetical protein